MLDVARHLKAEIVFEGEIATRRVSHVAVAGKTEDLDAREVNAKVLKEKGVEVPTSWEALLDPKLKSQVSTAHPSTSGTAFTTLWTQVVLRGGEDQALDYMKKMHSNVLQYTKSGTAPGQIAGRGEVAVGLVFSHDCVLYKERGMSDLEVSFPAEGTGYEIGGVAVVKNGPNTAAAKAAEAGYEFRVPKDSPRNPKKIGRAHV